MEREELELEVRRHALEAADLDGVDEGPARLCGDDEMAADVAARDNEALWLAAFWAALRSRRWCSISAFGWKASIGE